MKVVFFCWSAIVLCLVQVYSTEAQDVRKPPHITNPDRPETRYVKAGHPFQLKCEADATPKANYKWKKNGDDLVVQNGVSFDSRTGTLKFEKYRYYYHDGEYMCIATNVFEIPGAPRATSFSHIISLKEIRIEITEGKKEDLTGNKYSYFMMPCNYTGDVVGPDMSHSWYRTKTQIQMEHYKDRLFIDAKGNLHFTYLLETDKTDKTDEENVGGTYSCSVGSVKHKTIKFSEENRLTISDATPVGKKPELKSKTDARAKLYSTAILECVFSGYDPDVNKPRAPRVIWNNKYYGTIKTDGGKYVISADTRQLTIKNIQETDEGDYYCSGKNGFGESGFSPVTLDIYSEPIWEPKSTGGPSEETVPEGVDFAFSCSTRSLAGEQAPSDPTWYINGEEFGSQHSPNDFEMSADKKKLTVKSVTKDRSIMCVQCEVSNDDGTTWGNGCLNVILPITVKSKPPAKQEIEYGDVIQLSVKAETDPSIDTLSYQWHFKKSTYDYDKLPFIEVDDDGNRIINTSKLTKDEFKNATGVYELKIHHNYDERYIKTEVLDKTPAPTGSPATAVNNSAFEWWMVIVPLAIIVIIALIVGAIIVKKKNPGDEYKLEKEEKEHNLDPEQDLLNQSFHEL